MGVPGQPQVESCLGEEDKIAIYLQNLVDGFDTSVKVRQCQFLPFSSPAFKSLTTDSTYPAPT
jgi:hypothetical protein